MSVVLNVLYIFQSVRMLMPRSNGYSNNQRVCLFSSCTDQELLEEILIDSSFYLVQPMVSENQKCFFLVLCQIIRLKNEHTRDRDTQVAQTEFTISPQLASN